MLLCVIVFLLFEEFVCLYFFLQLDLPTTPLDLLGLRPAQSARDREQHGGKKQLPSHKRGKPTHIIQRASGQTLSMHMILASQMTICYKKRQVNSYFIMYILGKSVWLKAFSLGYVLFGHKADLNVENILRWMLTVQRRLLFTIIMTLFEMTKNSVEDISIIFYLPLS